VLCLGVVILNRRYPSVVFPQRITGSAHIRDKLARMLPVKVAHGCGEHDHVTRRLTVNQDQFFGFAQH
jgi:hypothetical protein